MTDAEALLLANHGVWPEHPDCGADCGWGTPEYDGTVHNVGLAMAEAYGKRQLIAQSIDCESGAVMDGA